MMRIAIPVALLFTTLAAAQTTRSGADDELERALKILQRLDGITASVNYVDMPLEDVIEDLNWFIDVPLTADWDALIDVGVDADAEVTLRLEDVPLTTVLAAVTLQLGTDFDRPRVEVFKGGMLMLTSEEGTNRMRSTDVYDVRDLLADGRAIDELRRTAPSRAPEVSEESSPEESSSPNNDTGTTQPDWKIPARVEGEEPTPDPPMRPRRQRTPGEELMTLVCEHVDPESWIEFGGTRASISERDGVLMVSAAPTVHRNLRDALHRLRRAFASLVTIDAAIVDIPRALYERLTRRHELSSAALGRAILAATETRVLWRAAAGTAMKKPLVFESKDETAAVTIELIADLDRATGVLAVEVRAQSEHDGDQRSVRTAVTIPYRHGGAAIELPAAAAGETVRLVVLIPGRG